MYSFRSPMRCPLSFIAIPTRERRERRETPGRPDFPSRLSRFSRLSRSLPTALSPMPAKAASTTEQKLARELILTPLESLLYDGGTGEKSGKGATCETSGKGRITFRAFRAFLAARCNG